MLNVFENTISGVSKRDIRHLKQARKFKIKYLVIKTLCKLRISKNKNIFQRTTALN